MNIIDMIDKALDDYAVSEDAMRWTPADAAPESTGCGCFFCLLLAQLYGGYSRVGGGLPVGVSPVAWAARTVRGAALNGVVLDEATALVPQSEDSPSDPRARALWLRQNRNIGPAVTVGLDGRRRT